MGQSIVVSEASDVTTLTFTSPANRIDGHFLEELKEALSKVQGRVLVLTGKENFSLGFDLKALASMDKGSFYGLSELGQEVCGLLEDSSPVTIAVLTGYVMGPGLEIALCCDFRIASDTALFGFPEVKLGLLPAFGTMHRLPALIGHSKSKRLLVTGKTLHAEEAEWLGLIDGISQKPVERAQKMAAALAAAPSSFRETKRLLSKASLAEERNAFAACCTEELKRRIEVSLQAAAGSPKA